MEDYFQIFQFEFLDLRCSADFDLPYTLVRQPCCLDFRGLVVHIGQPCNEGKLML